VVIGVEQWAEIRRLYFVKKRSKRAIQRLTGLHRDTITRALASEAPPRYERVRAGSKLDPYREWICEQLKAEPTIRSQRLRELASEFGYTGGKHALSAG
jgi:transposase